MRAGIYQNEKYIGAALNLFNRKGELKWENF